MSDYIYTDGELCHFGVKGMKWGIRKERKKEGRNLRRASRAKTEEEKNEYLKRADEHSKKAKELEKTENKIQDMKKQVENMLDISEESASFINRATESYYKVNGEINKRVFEKGENPYTSPELKSLLREREILNTFIQSQRSDLKEANTLASLGLSVLKKNGATKVSGIAASTTALGDRFMMDVKRMPVFPSAKQRYERDKKYEDQLATVAKAYDKATKKKK